MPGSSQHDRGERFRALHRGEPFVIPNPPDAGAARILEALGAKALATTSSGFAYTLGRRDGEVTLDEVVAHVRALTAAVDIPVAADLENGYGPRPQDAAAAVRAAAGAGAVGASIEDFDPHTGLYDRAHATERIAAAADAARALEFPFTLTARAENHIRGNPDLDDTIARLQAYEQAGADVLFAPGLTIGQLRQVRAATTLPINALGGPGRTLAAYADAGAQRVSVGGSLTWVAATAFVDAAQRLLEGDLDGLSAGDGNRVAGLLEGAP